MREIYKLRTIDNLTFREIGEEFDITANRATQIYKKGIAMATGVGL
jgi:DNA-directed RNA polymerase specialized sigma subunit